MNNLIQKDVPVLDSLRAFAALSVCLFHFVCTTTGYIQTDWILSVFNVGRYGVQLFFVISGFIIPWSMYNAGYEFRNFFSFFLKRLSRLEPPYIFSVLLAIALLLVREKFYAQPGEHATISAPQIALHLGYLIPFFKEYHWLNPVYWTLAIEFQYYLLIALVFVPLLKAGRALRWLLLAALILPGFYLSDIFVFYWLPVFMLGILLFLYSTRLISTWEFAAATAVMFGICIYRYPVQSVIYAAIPVACILFFRNVKVPGLHFAGKFSYSIYLIHPLLGATFVNVLSHHIVSPAGKAAVILGGVLVTLVSAWIVYLVIERPSKKLSASISYRKTKVVLPDEGM